MAEQLINVERDRSSYDVDAVGVEAAWFTSTTGVLAVIVSTYDVEEAPFEYAEVGWC